MDDTSFDDLLNTSAPAVADRDPTLLAALDELVQVTGQPSPRRRRLPRTAVAGVVVAGTLGLGGVAAAGGWLPALSWSPWADQQFGSGQSCHLRFMANEQSEPARLGGISRTEQRETIVAAQAWLDRFDVSTIDMDDALAKLQAAQTETNANQPSSEIYAETPQELEVHALIYATGIQLRAALAAQGLNPNATDIITTTECQDQP